MNVNGRKLNQRQIEQPPTPQPSTAGRMQTSANYKTMVKSNNNIYGMSGLRGSTQTLSMATNNKAASRSTTPGKVSQSFAK